MIPLTVFIRAWCQTQHTTRCPPHDHTSEYVLIDTRKYFCYLNEVYLSHIKAKLRREDRAQGTTAAQQQSSTQAPSPATHELLMQVFAVASSPRLQQNSAPVCSQSDVWLGKRFSQDAVVEEVTAPQPEKQAAQSASALQASTAASPSQSSVVAEVADVVVDALTSRRWPRWWEGERGEPTAASRTSSPLAPLAAAALMELAMDP